MDNDMMARRLRPPSEPGRASRAPNIPSPSAAPWDAPESQASREEILWDRPAEDVWPPEPGMGETVDASEPAFAADATPTTFEANAEPQSSLLPEGESDDPFVEFAATAVTPDMAAEAEATDVPIEANADVAFEPAPASPEPSVDAPWDRPADDADAPMDARADGPSWDEPPSYDDYGDDDDVYDDRPTEMFELFQMPVAAVAEAAVADESAVAESESAVATSVTTLDAEAMARDPYDETAPVVADVVEHTGSDWLSWNGHGAAAAVDAAAAPDVPAESAFAPWEDVATATEELPEPDPFAPWDTVADDATEATSEDSAEEAEPWFAAEPTVEAPAAEDGPGFIELWAVAAAVETEPAVEAEPEPTAALDDSAWIDGAAALDEVEAETQTDAPPEAAAETEAVNELSVPVQLPLSTDMPATLYASGPEAGLPQNVVLKIQLSIVDEAHREAAGPAPFALATPITADHEPMAAAPAADPSSAWPDIWDGSTLESAWPAAPEATQAHLVAPADAWPAADREVYAPAVGLTAPELGALAVAQSAESAETAPRVSTINEPQSDLWFLSAEPGATSDAEAESESGAAQPRSMLTWGVTVVLAVAVVALVLLFIWLLTNLLR